MTRLNLAAGTAAVCCLFLSACSSVKEKQAFQKLRTTSIGIEAERITRDIGRDDPSLKNISSSREELQKFVREAWGREAESHLQAMRKAVTGDPPNPSQAEKSRSAFYVALGKSGKQITDFNESELSLNQLVGLSHMSVARTHLEAARRNGAFLSMADVKKFGPSVLSRVTPSRAHARSKSMAQSRTRQSRSARRAQANKR